MDIISTIIKVLQKGGKSPKSSVEYDFSTYFDCACILNFFLQLVNQ